MLMHLLRCLFFIEARFDFQLVATHIRGEVNTLADNLSCDALPAFFSMTQQMDPVPTPIELRLSALLLEAGDWTSQTWTASFSAICIAA